MNLGTGGMISVQDYQNYTLPWDAFSKISIQEFATHLVDGEFRGFLANSPNRPVFEQQFGLYGLGMRVLENRYNFFSRLLRGEAELLEIYKIEVGTGDLEKRLLFALHSIFVCGARVLRTYDDMLGNYPEYIKQRQAPANRPGSDCRSVQVCRCQGGAEPFTSYCLSLDDSILLPFQAQLKKPVTQADIDKLFG